MASTDEKDDNEKIYYKLGAPYDKVTGMLNNMYEVKNGVVELHERSRRKSGRILKEHYGAKEIPNPYASVQAQAAAAAAPTPQSAAKEAVEAKK